jgi:hypothetical protein
MLGKWPNILSQTKFAWPYSIRARIWPCHIGPEPMITPRVLWREGVREATNSFHWAGPFLRCFQLCSCSRTPQHYIASERSLPCSLSWVAPTDLTPPRTITLRFISILCKHLHLCLHTGLFYSGFPNITLYEFLSSPLALNVLPISSPWIHHRNYTWWRVQVLSILIKQPLPTPSFHLS